MRRPEPMVWQHDVRARRGGGTTRAGGRGIYRGIASKLLPPHQCHLLSRTAASILTTSHTSSLVPSCAAHPSLHLRRTSQPLLCIAYLLYSVPTMPLHERRQAQALQHRTGTR